jgi:DNA topoisomerase I
VARLRRVDCSGPGITRRRRGKGFEYLDEDGNRIEDEEVIARIRELAIPPAWQDVWICPYPMGHLQATGTDAAGRKQYLYHERWRERRDQEKFDEMIEFARSLPLMRRRVNRHLAREGMERERVLACAVKLLDIGFFRVGGEDYAADNESYGLATMKKSHVTCTDGWITFDYPAKSGQRHVKSLVDEDVFAVVSELKRRRGGGEELLAFKDGRRWRDVRSADINNYIKEVTGADYSAKDFRTWNATVLAAVALAVAPVARRSKTATSRAITWAIKQVAHYLGNTPAVARSSYIDPRIFDRYRAGYTISGALPDVMAEELATMLHGPAEEAVLDLLEKDLSSNGVEKAREFEKLAA